MTLQSWLRGTVQRKRHVRRIRTLFECVQHPSQGGDAAGQCFYHNLASHVCSWTKPHLLREHSLPVMPYSESDAGQRGLLPPHGTLCIHTSASFVHMVMSAPDTEGSSTLDYASQASQA